MNVRFCWRYEPFFVLFAFRTALSPPLLSFPFACPLQPPFVLRPVGSVGVGSGGVGSGRGWGGGLCCAEGFVPGKDQDARAVQEFVSASCWAFGAASYGSWWRLDFGAFLLWLVWRFLGTGSGPGSRI